MATIDALLDTNILIGLWRRDPAMQAWIDSLPDEMVVGLPVLVVMEFIDGARNMDERKRAIKLLESYPVIHLESADSVWAQEQHANFKLSHNVGIIDALIAAPAARLKVPIYTLNTKHFSPLPDVNAIRPY
jgi:predicted nucleic acid-binding protein